MRKLTLLLLFTLSFSILKSQNTSIGFFGGGMNYKGDLSPKQAFSIKGLNGAVGLRLKHRPDSQWALNLQGIAGKITGDDRDFEYRMLYRQLDVTTILIELVTTAEWHPFMKEEVNLANRKFLDRFSPFLYFGIGIVWADVAVRGLPEKAPELVRGLNNGTYMSIPVGVGINFDFNERISLDVDFGLRFPTTDNLDGISINRNPNINDWYYLLGITANYRFGATSMKTKTKPEE
jgi:hypothetical protein